METLSGMQHGYCSKLLQVSFAELPPTAQPSKIVLSEPKIQTSTAKET